MLKLISKQPSDLKIMKLLQKEAANFGHTVRKPEAVRISELPYCPRKIFYRMKNTPEEEVSTRFKNQGLMGHILHVFSTELFKNGRVLYDDEGEVEFETNGCKITGHFDNIIELEDDDKKRLIDVKTCLDYRYVPVKHHGHQLMLYLHAKGYDEGHLVYVIRDIVNCGFSCMSFTVRVDKQIVNELLAKAVAVMCHYKENSLPPKTDEEWQCSNRTTECPFYEACMTEDEIDGR